MSKPDQQRPPGGHDRVSVSDSWTVFNLVVLAVALVAMVFWAAR